MTARSSSHYRGDEANVDDRRIGGFMLVNALGSYRVSRAVTLFARVDNLLDTDYATFGLYGEADEVLGDQYEDSNRFIGPGAPRAFMPVSGLRYPQHDRFHRSDTVAAVCHRRDKLYQRRGCVTAAPAIFS